MKRAPLSMQSEPPLWASLALLLLISGTFLLVGLDRVNEATNPGFEDTPAFLQVALFIKDNGGASNFLHLCLTGAYKAAVKILFTRCCYLRLHQETLRFLTRRGSFLL